MNVLLAQSRDPNLFSLVETAKANGVEPHAYLSLMLEKLPNAQSAEDFEALLPWNLKSGLRAGSQSPSPSWESME